MMRARFPVAAVAALLLFCGCGGKAGQCTPGGIVSLLPSITEDLYALGLGDRVCAVSQYCKYPPQALAKPKAGDCINPNLEAVVRLRPEVVIIGDMQTEAEAKFSAFGIKAMKFRQSTLSDLYSTLAELGKAFDRQREADSLISHIRGRLDSLRVVCAPARKKKVLFIVGRNPGTLSNIFTVNHESFLDELLQIAGGVSIFSDAGLMWAKVSTEEILRRDPEYIIETSTMGHQDDPLKVWAALPSISAVKEGRISMLSDDYIFIPGPRVVETAEKLADILSDKR